MRTYKLFKSTFEYSLYLDKFASKLRIPLTKLRLSSHQLRIETGRYGNNRTEHNQRYCTICNNGDIEDEFHFVCVCDVYVDLRRTYLNRYFFVRPSMFKFIDLMLNTTYQVQRNLCKFISVAFVRRYSIVKNITSISLYLLTLYIYKNHIY